MRIEGHNLSEIGMCSNLNKNAKNQAKKPEYTNNWPAAHRSHNHE
jgi:hypothetical protein